MCKTNSIDVGLITWLNITTVATTIEVTEASIIEVIISNKTGNGYGFLYISIYTRTFISATT